MSDLRDEAILKLREFVAGPDRSKDAAGQLEDALFLAFPEDGLIEDLLDGLAQYQPGGGEFLYDAGAMTHWCSRVLKRLEG